jgi:hypothetical protein
MSCYFKYELFQGFLSYNLCFFVFWVLSNVITSMLRWVNKVQPLEQFVKHFHFFLGLSHWLWIYLPGYRVKFLDGITCKIEAEKWIIKQFLLAVPIVAITEIRKGACVPFNSILILYDVFVDAWDCRLVLLFYRDHAHCIEQIIKSVLQQRQQASCEDRLKLKSWSCQNMS